MISKISTKNSRWVAENHKILNESRREQIKSQGTDYNTTSSDFRKKLGKTFFGQSSQNRPGAGMPPMPSINTIISNAASLKQSTYQMKTQASSFLP